MLFHIEKMKKQRFIIGFLSNLQLECSELEQKFVECDILLLGRFCYQRWGSHSKGIGISF